MRKLHRAVSEALDRVDFPSLFPGFHRFPFALYNGETVTLCASEIPCDRRFLGNTAIEFEGGFLAIWKVEAPREENPTLLAASLVHEMFHALQRERGETRFPNDLVGLDYPRTAEVLLAKEAEYALLRAAFAAFVAAEKRALLERFAAYRLYREAWMGDIIGQEYLVETAEGMAEFVSLKALRALSESAYMARLEKHLGSLEPNGGYAFDMRRLAYFSGSLFLLALEDAGVNVAHEVGGEKRPAFTLFSGGIAPTAPPAPEGNALSAALALAKEYEDALSARFLAFKTQRTIRREGPFYICGYDPMNMIRHRDEVLCTHFVMLAPEGGAPQFIEGPVLLYMERDGCDKVLAYETAQEGVHV
ncbi:MAG: hypothetical protein ABFC62_01275 [Clostridiaceae bacterium]|nr:hypothetical protein [Eubacteriales bacterium]